MESSGRGDGEGNPVSTTADASPGEHEGQNDWPAGSQESGQNETRELEKDTSVLAGEDDACSGRTRRAACTTPGGSSGKSSLRSGTEFSVGLEDTHDSPSLLYGQYCSSTTEGIIGLILQARRPVLFANGLGLSSI